jgi:hypothetical protein
VLRQETDALAGFVLAGRRQSGRPCSNARTPPSSGIQVAAKASPAPSHTHHKEEDMMSVIKALLGTAVASVLGLGPASAAHAATFIDHHNLPYLYLFTDSWYEDIYDVYPDSEDNFSYSDNDEASSAKNLSAVAWVLYDDTYYRDRRFCIRPGEEVPDLGAPAYEFSDKISSVKRLDTASCAGYPTFNTEY